MLRLERHTSYDLKEPFFYVKYGDIDLFYTFSEETARERFNLIKSMGVNKYMEMIKPQVDVLEDELSEEQRQDVNDLLGYLAGER